MNQVLATLDPHRYIPGTVQDVVDCSVRDQFTSGEVHDGKYRLAGRLADPA